MSSPLILGVMTFCFLFFGYLGVPVPFSLMAGVFVGAILADVGPKERQFQDALLLTHGIRVEALADDGVVVPGQRIKLSLVTGNNGAADVAVKSVRFDGFDGEPAACSGGVPSGTAR